MNDKNYIVGNWKMNLLVTEAEALVQKIIQNYQVKESQSLIIAPQFPMLFLLQSLLKNTKIKLSAQNCAAEKTGAFTGEVSCLLLKETCQYCIIGHSERRNIFQETNLEIAKKFFLLQELGIIPIFCVGENIYQRENKQVKKVLTEQIKPILETKNKSFLIAYEPVWAIGTGKVANSEQISEVHLFIYELLTKASLNFKSIPILYGGSVQSKNASLLMKIKHLHGLLIGGASLNAAEFLKIAQIAQK